MLLKRGMVGPEVGRLVKDLVAAGYPPNSDPGNNFNRDVEAAVKAFQSQNIGPNLVPLVVDGQAGPLTRWALDVALGKTPMPDVPNQDIGVGAVKPTDSSNTGWSAIQIAIRELNAGAGESGSDNAGPDVMRYHAISGGKKGWDWCASFVSYCFHEGNPGAMPFEPSYGARTVLERFKKKHWDYKASIASPPAAGDIIVWWRVSLNDWRGHIGLVASYANGIVKTIEGNRGPFPAKVKSFSYTLGQIDRLLGFGRSAP
jgi:hypothetical protein